MKQALLFFSLIFVFNLQANGIHLDAVQQKVVNRAPYLKNLIEAYNHRLAVDEQPVHVIKEMVTLLYRTAPDFDPQTYQKELMEKYGSSIDEQQFVKSELAKLNIAQNTAGKINDGGGACWSVASAQSQKSELMLSVWQDERNGVDDPDIYGQFFDLDMQAVGGNFVVHKANGGIAQNHPGVAALSSGGFIAVWEDYRHDNSAIYARLFADDRTPLADEFRIESATSGQLKPAVAADGDGHFTITWLQNGGADYNVYARVYNNDATALTPTFMVNDNKDAFQWFPVIASANSGESLIAWEDKRDGSSDIYAQRLRADGSKRAGNFQVDDAVGNAIQWQPNVTAGANQFVVAWEDYRDNPVGIYAQWFNSSLLADGDNRRVDDYLVSSIKELPVAAINNAGETTFCWQDGRGENYHLCAQTFTTDKTADLFVNLNSQDGEQRFPDLQMNDRMLSFFWVQKDADSEVTTICSDQVLWTDVPVELAAFNLSFLHNNVECSWTTMSETNNLGFAVERSVNGVNYDEIGFVDGYGTATEIHHYSYTDSNPPRGNIYYRLKQMDFNGAVAYSAAQHVSVELPTLPFLLSNYPNPFNPNTTITYQLDSMTRVKIDIFDIAGKVVTTLVNEQQDRGRHQISWDGSDAFGSPVVSGTYVYRLRAGDQSAVGKMVLMR